MEAVDIPDGDNGESPAVAATTAPNRRRARRATFLLFIAASASLLLILLSSPPSSDNGTALLISRLPSSLPQGLGLPTTPYQLKQSLSTTLFSTVPRLGRQAFENTKSTAFSVKTFSAESAELAWETSENAFHQLSGHRRLLMLDEEEEDVGGKRDNPLERALGGLGMKKNKKKNNLRKEEQSKNNNKQQHRNMKKREAGGTNNSRRNNAKVNPKQDEDAGQKNMTGGWIMSLIVNSPLAAPLLAFCGALFLMASLIMNPRRTRTTTTNNTIILDENEAEIVEFYEKEMECGTLFGVPTIPFLQQDNGVERGMEEKNPHPSMKRQGSENRWLMNSESRNVSDPSLLLASNHHVHHRSASDPLLTRHHTVVRPGVETRESQCDSYYSRVLKTLHYAEDDEDDLQIDEGVERNDREGQLTLVENVSSLTESAEETEQVAKHCTVEPAVTEDEDKCFESEAETNQHPQSLLSPSSSISSLTSEGCDIEAPFGGPSCQDDNKTKHDREDSSAVHGFHTYIVTPGPEHVSKSTMNIDTNSEYSVSSTSATPPRSNLYKDRRPSSIKIETNIPSRRVSFSHEVKVCEIPMQTKRQPQHDEFSSESYLYVMLFTVAIAIAVFSLMPAHPSLSPISSMTRGEIFERAETLLNSQWDVEL